MAPFAPSTIRTFLIIGAAAATVASCSPADPAPGVSSAADVAASSARLGPEVSKGLASVKNATAKFHNVNAAMAAGYVDPSGIPCVASPAGTMGIHVVNPALLDQTVDPDRPELLLYLPKANGGFKLIGVEYLVPVLVRNNTTGVISPWFAATPWGPGYTQLTQQPSVFGEGFEGPMPPHEPGTPWHYDKHVWAWETNPSGMFAQWNPSISCP